MRIRLFLDLVSFEVSFELQKLELLNVVRHAEVAYYSSCHNSFNFKSFILKIIFDM